MTRGVPYSSVALPPRGRLASQLWFRRQFSVLAPASPVESFRAALDSKHRSAIKESFAQLLNQADKPAASGWPQLESSDIMRAVNVLALSPNQHAYELLRRIYLESVGTLGLRLEPEHHRAAVAVLARTNPKDALEAARGLDPDVLTEHDWANLLSEALQRRLDQVQRVWQAARIANKLTDRVAAVRIRQLHYRKVRRETADDVLAREAELLAEMKRDGVVPGVLCEIEMAQLRIDVGDLAGAGELRQKWKREDLSNDVWTAVLRVDAERAVASEDVASLTSAVTELTELGLPLPSVALNYLVSKRLAKSAVGTEDILDIITEVETVTGRPATTKVWGNAFTTFLSTTTSTDALDSVMVAYADFRSRGIGVNRPLAKVMIDILVNVHPPRLDDAMNVCGDLLAMHKSHPNDPTYRPDADIFFALMQASTRTEPPDFANIVTLCEQVHALGIHIRTTTLGSFIIQLIRTAPGHNTAFNLYDNLRNLGWTHLTDDQYNLIAAEFISLSNGKSLLPPPDLVIEIIKDMRRVGLHPRSHILTALLTRYGQLARVFSKGSRESMHHDSLSTSLLSSIRTIHTLLRLDSYLEMDVPLLAALMGAYSSLESFNETFEVWQEIVERRPRDQIEATHEQMRERYAPAISVVIDSCGHLGSLSRARKAWAWARRHELENQHNWDAWVECLARLGQVDEAVHVVFEEMGSGKVPAPTEETVAILLKFSWNNKEHWETVPDLVRSRFPEWWPSLKKIVETKSSKRA